MSENLATPASASGSGSSGSASTSGSDGDISTSVPSKGTDGIEDLEAADAIPNQDDDEDIPEEAISPSSKLGGEDPEIMQARR